MGYSCSHCTVCIPVVPFSCPVIASHFPCTPALPLCNKRHVGATQLRSDHSRVGAAAVAVIKEHASDAGGFSLLHSLLQTG